MKQLQHPRETKKSRQPHELQAQHAHHTNPANVDTRLSRFRKFREWRLDRIVRIYDVPTFVFLVLVRIEMMSFFQGFLKCRFSIGCCGTGPRNCSPSRVNHKRPCFWRFRIPWNLWLSCKSRWNSV